MKCEKAQELFSDHVEGALERPMAVTFDRHLAECPSCELDYSLFRATYQMLETLPEIEPPSGFACDVVMKVRLQREASLRTRRWWQSPWSEGFAFRMPAKVFAGASALIFLTMLLMHAPITDVVTAWFLPARSESVKVDSPVQWQASRPAMAWLYSGLSFELDPSSTGEGRSLFRLLLKPKDTTGKHVHVYLMNRGQVRFDDKSIDRASLVWEGDVRESGQVIPFILGGTGTEQEVLTALIVWEHRQRKFIEAVFVPTQISATGATTNGSVRISNAEVYTALQEISAAFGAVILVNADINAVVGSVDVENGTVDDALYKLSTDVGLRWRPLGAQVYQLERKVE